MLLLPVCPQHTSKQVSQSLQLQKGGWERISKEGLKQKDRVSRFVRKTKQIENTAEMNCYISNPGNMLWKDYQGLMIGQEPESVTQTAGRPSVVIPPSSPGNRTLNFKMGTQPPITSITFPSLLAPRNSRVTEMCPVAAFCNLS